MSFITYIKKLFGFHKESRRNHFDGIIQASSFNNSLLSNNPTKLVVVGELNNPKWVQFYCPDDCKEIISVNLMSSSFPHWTMEYNPKNEVTLDPSVDVKKCKSHFWIKDNKIMWV